MIGSMRNRYVLRYFVYCFFLCVACHKTEMRSGLLKRRKKEEKKEVLTPYQKLFQEQEESDSSWADDYS